MIALVAVLIFAGILPGFRNPGGSGNEVEVVLWGVFPESQMRRLISDVNDSNQGVIKINYVEKSADNYEDEIIDALASGTGPDIWFLTQDAVFKNKNKIFLIPHESYSERDFRNNFIDSAELFVDAENKKIIALPVAVDPLILYWNKDLFSSAGISRPPQYWDEFLSSVSALTKIDQAGNIIQSGAAIGEFRNIKNAKDILSMLILQSGNPIIKSGTMEVKFGEKMDSIFDPTESAVRFFNEFSNPSKSSYSWNRALPNSDTMFVGGFLAMYFGSAGEYGGIKQKNPHLNFDVAEVPQIRDGKIRATFGRIYAVAVSKNTPNAQSSAFAAFKLSEKNFSKSFSEKFGLASARRDVLAEGATEPAAAVFYKSAVMSRTWLEPNPQLVYEIFKDMVESSATGRARVSEAVKLAKNRIEEMLK